MHEEGKKIKAIIIDDEPGCISNLEYYINKYCPAIEIVATGNTTTDVLNLITTSFDVAFLDIELSNDNIFSILSKENHSNFDIIFVTAYEQYALKAFNVDVLDYILKPLSQKAMLSCYEKILRRYQQKDNNEGDNKGLGLQQRLVLKQGDKVYVISYNDIIYMEAHGIYTNIHFEYNNYKVVVTVSKSLSQLEELYIHDNLYRVHRSFIINTTKIKSIIKKGTLEVKMNTDDNIPVAKRRATEFLSSIRV